MPYIFTNGCKKIRLETICLALAGLLCACGGGQGEREPSSIAAGYAEADITPPIGYPLGGFGAPGGLRLATGVHDPILTQVAVLYRMCSLENSE